MVHGQKQTPWGLVAVTLDPGAYVGPTRTNTKRKALLAMGPAVPVTGDDGRSLGTRTLLSSPAAASPQGWAPPLGWADPDRNLTLLPSLTGVPGTFNYLTGASLRQGG